MVRRPGTNPPMAMSAATQASQARARLDGAVPLSERIGVLDVLRGPALFGRWWLRHLGSGPLEWVRRYVTYWMPQPLHLTETSGTHAVASA